MAQITLKSINAANWQACANLQVRENQAEFVPGNLYSIAEAQFYPDAVPLALYDEQEQLVGFVMYGVDTSNGKWKVFRLMIDRAHQGKGYGRAAMQQVIERLRTRHNCAEILICYRPENTAARRLYASLGFVEQSITQDKIQARLELF